MRGRVDVDSEKRQFIFLFMALSLGWQLGHAAERFGQGTGKDSRVRSDHWQEIHRQVRLVTQWRRACCESEFLCV